jgi:hypothetical protein
MKKVKTKSASRKPKVKSVPRKAKAVPVVDQMIKIIVEDNNGNLYGPIDCFQSALEFLDFSCYTDDGDPAMVYVISKAYTLTSPEKHYELKEVKLTPSAEPL